MNVEAELRSLADRWRQAKYILAFTGAGISTPSGIPSFRGKGGIWSKFQPVYFDEFVRDHEARIRHWKYKLETWKDFRDAEPNKAHLSLAELDRLGRLDMLVTQNIDGLHQMAGHSDFKVIELHGTNRKIECISCGDRTDPEPVFAEFEKSGEPPRCRCGGFLKPATVSFGQAMPVDDLQQAMGAARKADLVISVGSTLGVEPAATVPRRAKEFGAYYVIVNQGATAHDSIADLRFEGDAAVLLPALLRLIEA
jgi:NAD-dependent deacetylase